MKVFWKQWNKWWFQIFLLLIPTQLGKHFWFEWSMVSGVRVDYLSPVIYAIDGVWGLWMVGELVEKRWFEGKKWWSFGSLLIGVLVGLNILVATNKWVAVYRWLRLGQWIISYNVIKSKKLEVKKYLKWIIPCWIVGESLLGWAQMVKGESLNGWWWWLGERRFSYTTIGIAQISVWGEGLVRAYGTFSHPNSMAGFMAVVMWLWLKLKFKINNRGWWVVLWLIVLGVIISGSRTVWILTTMLLIVQWKQSVKSVLLLMGAVALLWGLIGVNYTRESFLGGWDNEGINKRMSLNLIALKMIGEKMMLGVGAGNFIVKLPEYQAENRFYWLQPVHNIFLLATAEWGLLGVVLIVWLLGKSWPNHFFKKNMSLILILGVSGMVDHYWITLPQNMWLLAMVLAII